ncbi:MAG TPA: nuclear transport factor 2 family protein [Candidatus Limnocylindria bacterium]|jgi:ketosteroid isomerase-like protein|nr:nuclear transport factor 2 family protein [Candidatus Limnocylindria bacterium]
MTTTEDTTTFRRALDEHLGAIQTKNLVRFAATLGDNVTVVDGAGGIVQGTDRVLRSHAAWFADADPWTFAYEVQYLRDLGTAGLALIDVTYRQTPEATPSRFLLSLVFVRESDGTWKFVYDQNTSRPNAA